MPLTTLQIIKAIQHSVLVEKQKLAFDENLYRAGIHNPVNLAAHQKYSELTAALAIIDQIIEQIKSHKLEVNKETSTPTKKLPKRKVHTSNSIKEG